MLPSSTEKKRIGNRWKKVRMWIKRVLIRKSGTCAMSFNRLPKEDTLTGDSWK